MTRTVTSPLRPRPHAPVRVANREHLQTRALLNGKLVLVDERLVSFLEMLNGAMNPTVWTDFSCQGHPELPFVSAYVVLTSRVKEAIDRCEKYLHSHLQAALKYPIHLIDEGELLPDQLVHAERWVGGRVYLVRDIFDGSLWAKKHPESRSSFHMYPTHRITIRWRPEDYPHILAACESLAQKFKETAAS